MGVRMTQGQRPAHGGSRRRRALSIRARLMILALVATLPILIERIHNEENDRNNRVATAYSHALNLAHQAAATQSEAIVSVRAFLQSVASARAAFHPSDAECSDFLVRIAKPVPWVKTLSVANLQGKIICSSFPGAIGLDISDRSHFTDAVDSGDFVLSDYFLASRIKGAIITAAMAQTGPNGAAAAVILGVVDLHWFEQMADAFAVHSGRLLMVDGKGVVLARSPASDEWVGQNLSSHPLVAEMLAKPEGTFTGEGIDGVRGIFGFAQMPGTRARFAVGFDEREVLGRANHAMSIALVELGAVIALVMFGIWFGGERLLMRPIRALAQNAVRIGHGGGKEHLTDLPMAAEFVPLAAAMEDMAGQLAAREQQLRDTNNQLLELAHIDALTGLANRRAFNAQLAREWKLAAQLGQPIAVMMIDVDHFKLFNDHYGHVQGDACLRKVGSVLKAATRTEPETSEASGELRSILQRAGDKERCTDFAARYGGEEFAVLLRGADTEIAAKVAERLRRAVENLLMTHHGAPLGFVSISIGVAAVAPDERQCPQVLTEWADMGSIRLSCAVATPSRFIPRPPPCRGRADRFLGGQRLACRS
jgi:GGDEF domain-containing protein